MAATTGTPTATYRLQLAPGFTFADAAAIAPYLKSLGISHIYLSPVFEAVPGSEHGYDVTDPTRFRAELGGEPGFHVLAETARQAGMGLIVDIVPNHMSASHHNPWWYDVMRFGKSSEYASFFEIHWDAGPGQRLVLPVLGEDAAAVAQAGQLKIVASDTGLEFAYFESRFPLAPSSYPAVLGALAQDVGEPVASRLGELVQRFAEFGPQDAGERDRVLAAMREAGRVLQGPQGPGGSALDRVAPLPVLELQHYRLEQWRTGLGHLNYRRFFDISGLVGVRVEERRVLERTHELLRREVVAGRIQGVRVDHVDGLRDPGEYLRNLDHLLNGQHDASRPEVPVYVEKILAPSEELPGSWPVNGTTGYEFANAVNGVFVDATGLRDLRRHYSAISRQAGPFHEVEHRAKLDVIDSLFQPELTRLATQFAALGRAAGTGLEPAACANVIRMLTAHMGVYRSYSDAGASDAPLLAAINATEAGLPPAASAEKNAFRVLKAVVSGDGATPHSELAEDFRSRWRQFSGAVMGKGVEDTAFYRYAPLASLNEVGGDPSGEAWSLEAFHELNSRRSTGRLRSMNATSTHDTKRSEDVRARLSVLSELPDAWHRSVRQWMEMNAPLAKEHNGTRSPSLHAEWLFYQSLLGIWPLNGDTLNRESGEMAEIADRLAGYMLKAAREAKQETGWHEPDADYERSLETFVRDVLTGAGSRRFRASFGNFVEQVAFHGAVNSLTQTVLKLAAPGIPDFYRGTESWDFSLVDPDNRRPVDFGRLSGRMERLEAETAGRDAALPAFAAELFRRWPSGEIKQWVTVRGLQARNAHAGLFLDGDYTPLFADGPRTENLCAFMRAHRGLALLAAGCRLSTRVGTSPEGICSPGAWAGTTLPADDTIATEWTDVFTGKTIRPSRGMFDLSELFDNLPVALLIAGTAPDGGSE